MKSVIYQQKSVSLDSIELDLTRSRHNSLKSKGKQRQSTSCQKRGLIMKLWGGRFTKETNELVNHFNASLPFDCRFMHRISEAASHM